MIGRSIQALESNEDMLRDLQEQYQYVLADEHQDVNGSQNRILELLTAYHESPNIFVVGDEKQAIYRFQGASLENFLYFEDLFPSTKTIALTQNYRSGQTILDIAHSLVAVDDGPLKDLRVPLEAALIEKSDVSMTEFPHRAIEHDALLQQVKLELESGVAAGEMAVILRTNREVEEITSLLRNAGIAASASADGDILSHPITNQVSSLIDAVVNPESNKALFVVLHGSYWGITNPDLAKLLSAQTYAKKLVDLLDGKESLAELELSDVDSVLRVGQVLQEARERSLVESPQSVLAFLLEESGFLNSVMVADGQEGSRVLRRLYDEIEALVTQNDTFGLGDISEVFATYRSHNLGLNAPYISLGEDSVQVMTAHKSKGLEFEKVFIPHLNDSAWGGKRRRNLFDVPMTRHQHDEYDELDDERRLFYVALTRAKEQVFLSCSGADSSGKELLVSRLYDELDAELVTAELDDDQKSFSPVSNIKAKSHIGLETSLLQQLLAERGFSATSLNNYLKSPWDYFYRNVLRIPEVQPPHMLFGTAVHGVLEQVTKQHTLGRQLTDNEIKEQLELQLHKLPLSVEEFTRLHEKGLEVLFAYTPHLLSQLPQRTEEEKKVRVVLETGLAELPELPLTGMFDRLDFDEKEGLLRVVDYKTGKPKTRNVIEGKTKSSDGGYKRQLVFYALLLSLYDDDRYQTKEGVLSFVEPDQKGVIHEESFTVTEEEIEELKMSIIQSAKEIMAGDWLSENIESDSTEYEYLAQLWQERQK